MKIDLGYKINNKFDLIIWWSIVTLLGILIFSTAVGQALLILLILLGLFKIIKEEKAFSIKRPIVLPFVVFIGIRVLSIIFSEYPSLSVYSLNKEIFFYLIVFVFLTELSKYDEEKIRFLIRILIIAAIIASIIGTAKVLLGNVERATSTTSGYSTLGMFLSVIFSIVFTLGRNKEFFPSRTWWLVILFLLLSGILFTFNRSNWITIVIIIFIIGLFKERIILGVLLIIFALMIFLIPNLSERFNEIIHFPQHLSDRDVIWQGALMISDQHFILGFGTRTFKEIFPLYQQLVDKEVGGWHNEYLQVYMESGILGLLAFLWLMFSIYYWGIKTLKHSATEKFKFDLKLAVLAGLSIFYLNSLSGGFLLDPISKVLFFFLLAMASNLIGSQNKTT